MESKFVTVVGNSVDKRLGATVGMALRTMLVDVLVEEVGEVLVHSLGALLGKTCVGSLVEAKVGSKLG